MSASSLGLSEVEEGLRGTRFAGHIHAFASVASTNTLAVQAAQAGATAGVWIADEQTAGRGRGGHTWHSAAGDGLYVSVLLRPHLDGPDALKISLAAGVAAARAIEQAAGAAITLRWPNDLMESTPDPNGNRFEGRKLGGILTESAMAPDGWLSYAVVGIGINLNQQTMPPELEQVATSLRMTMAAEPRDTRREVLLPLLVSQLAEQVQLLEREASEAGAKLPPEGLLARFTAWSPMLQGVRVHVAEEGGYTGSTEGLDARGLLQVRAADGTLRIVRHGGVRRTAGEE